MRLRRFAVRVDDPEHSLFGQSKGPTLNQIQAGRRAEWTSRRPRISVRGASDHGRPFGEGVSLAVPDSGVFLCLSYYVVA